MDNSVRRPVMKQHLQEFFEQEWGTLMQDDISSADYYFNSYAHMGIHEEMLKDSVRTYAYQRAILQNAHLFKDKVVLDVGAGTGILSMFAAKAGAKQVIAIECSEIVHMARKIVAQNKLDHKITFIQAKCEEAVLPVDKVDIIISEWMGYFLLYESMLDTVIFARDKWLIEGGLIFPDKASMYIAGLEDGEYKDEKLGYWQNVYGFDYTCCKQSVIEEPLVDVVNGNAVNTNACKILDLDLNTCTVKDVDFAADFTLKVNRDDFVHGLVVWFDIDFDCCHKKISFTTSPLETATHWKQTVFYLEEDLIVNEDEAITGMIAVKKSAKNPRDLDIKIQYNFDGDKCTVNKKQIYRLR